MRKKLFIFAILAVFLFAGCANGAQATVSPEDELLKADGKTLITGEDFSFARKAADLQSELLGVSEKSDEQLFTELAELELLNALAEKLGVQSDITDEELQSSYDTYLTNASSGMTDSEDLNEYLSQLQSALDMTDEEFGEWNLSQYKKEINAEQVCLYAAESYTRITDPVYLEECILSELFGLSELLEIECGFPGMEDHTFTFETVVSS